MIKLIFKAFYEFILVLVRWIKEIYLCIKEECEAVQGKLVMAMLKLNSIGEKL